MTTTHDDELEELFNKTINAKKIAVETVMRELDVAYSGEIADAANVLLDKYRTEFKATIKSRELAARIDELENRLKVQFIPSHWARLCAEVNSWAKYVDRRLATLKSQQQENEDA